MAANPVGRLCECNCGGSIDHMTNNARYLPACRLRIRNANARAKTVAMAKVRPVRFCACQCGAEITHMRSDALRTRENESHKRVHVQSGMRLPTDPEYIPTIHCKVCFGLTWARTPDRMVANDTWRCKGCNEPYAPEPKPDFGSLLRSSAGTMKDAGKLWGCAIAGRGESYLKGNK